MPAARRRSAARLRQIAERHRGQALAGVVLLTDGVAGDLRRRATVADLPPIYPVLFGQDQPPRDLAIASTASSQTSFEDAPVTIQAEVQCAGLSRTGSAWESSRCGRAGKGGEAERVVAEQTWRVPADSGPPGVSLSTSPGKSRGAFLPVCKVSSGESALEATTGQ